MAPLPTTPTFAHKVGWWVVGHGRGPLAPLYHWPQWPWPWPWSPCASLAWAAGDATAAIGSGSDAVARSATVRQMARQRLVAVTGKLRRACLERACVSGRGVNRMRIGDRVGKFSRTRSPCSRPSETGRGAGALAPRLLEKGCSLLEPILGYSPCLSAETCGTFISSSKHIFPAQGAISAVPMSKSDCAGPDAIVRPRHGVNDWHAIGRG